MTLIHMLVGIPASGKTTFAKGLAKELNIPIVSTDETRNMHPNVSEDKIWPLVYEECGRLVMSNQDFIFDATNVTANVRDRFKEKINEYSKDYEIGAYYFDVDPNVCFNRAIERNKDPKERFIPPEVILSYGQKITMPTIEEGFKFVKVIKNDI